MKRPELPAKIAARVPFIYRLLDNKYYLDKFNEVVFARGAVAIGTGLWKEGDQVVIDGIVNGSARAVGWFAGVLRFLQSGYIYHYAFAMIIGMLALLTLFVTIGGK
jgi:NADH-quinone oxidoreductase subunit L